MKWKTIVCIVLSLAAVCSLALIRDSAAWFDTQTGQPLTQEIQAKKMYFEFNGKLASYLHKETTGNADFIITDQNLITDNEGKISGINYSTIATDVRFRIVYDKPSQQNTVYTGSASDDLAVEAASGWSGPDADGYFSTQLAAVQSETYFNMINSIAFDGEKVTRASYLPEDGSGNITPFSGSIRVEIQAKQHDHVTWAEIAAISTP